jgi:hypothetical protein
LSVRVSGPASIHRHRASFTNVAVVMVASFGGEFACERHPAFDV